MSTEIEEKIGEIIYGEDCPANTGIYLDDAIEDAFIELKKLEPGTEERTKAVQDIDRLVRLKLEAEKAQNDYEVKMTQVANEHEVKLAQHEADVENKEKEISLKQKELEEKSKQEKKQRTIKRVEVGATILGTLITGGLAVMKFAFGDKLLGDVLHFEETGSICSTGGKNIIGALFRKVFEK